MIMMSAFDLAGRELPWGFDHMHLAPVENIFPIAVKLLSMTLGPKSMPWGRDLCSGL